MSRSIGRQDTERGRRATLFSVYAALRELGRTGLADLIDRSCDHAASRQIAATVFRARGGRALHVIFPRRLVLGRDGRDI